MWSPLYWYYEIRGDIAEKLNWELISEEDDDGNTAIVLREKIS
ncbi:hypothetical protein [Chitinophaga varians]|nr:hypothetical protein [Chitinophaga varians]